MPACARVVNTSAGAAALPLACALAVATWLALPGGAVAAPDASPAAAAPTPATAASTPAPEGESGVLEATREGVRSTAEWLARSVDSWFGDRPFEQGGKVSDGRVSLDFLHRRDEGNDFSLRFNARFRLPNVEHNTYLFFGRDDQRELVTDTPAAFTRQNRLQAEQTSERKFFAGLGYDLRDQVDFRLGLRGGLKPYAQARFRQPWQVGERGLAEFRQTLFWSASDKLGSTTAFSYERAFSRTLALRWLNAATITQRSKAFDWSSDLALVKAYAGDRQASVEAIVDGTTGSGVAVHEYGLQTRYRQPVYRNWLQGELVVGHFRARADASQPRLGVWALGLGLKMKF